MPPCRCDGHRDRRNQSRADSAAVSDLIEKIKKQGRQGARPAWQAAAPLGAPAVSPLPKSPQSMRTWKSPAAAKRAMWKIVRHAGASRRRQEQAAVRLRCFPCWPRRAQRTPRISSGCLRDRWRRLRASFGRPARRQGPARRRRGRSKRIPDGKSLAALKSALRRGLRITDLPSPYRCRANRGETVKDYPSRSSCRRVRRNRVEYQTRSRAGCAWIRANPTTI